MTDMICYSLGESIAVEMINHQQMQLRQRLKGFSGVIAAEEVSDYCCD